MVKKVRLHLTKEENLLYHDLVSFREEGVESVYLLDHDGNPGDPGPPMTVRVGMVPEWNDDVCRHMGVPLARYVAHVMSR